MSTDLRKRRFLQGSAALMASGLIACRPMSPNAANEETSSKDEKNTHSSTRYDCYGPHQAGITTPHQAFGILSAFDINIKDKSQLINYFRTLTTRIEFLTQGGELQDPDPKLPPSGSGLLGKVVPPDGLTITVSVGASLFDQRFGLADKKPLYLQEMQRFPNDKLAAEWCDGDISIQICAFSPETCQNALRDLIKNTAQFAIARWVLDGWLPKAEAGAMAARNLFGFRDGTGNPDVSQPEIANQVL